MINRRTFNRAVGLSTGAAAVSLSAPQTNASATTGPAQPSSAAVPTVTPGTHTGFGTIKQVKAGLLNIGYAEAGPAHGPVVLLLHGWPYDIHSFVDVAPLLADQGYPTCAATAAPASCPGTPRVPPSSRPSRWTSSP
jgi:hypothetical protein